jgi:formamidopyrimidine-DNA glycosylase
VWTVKAVPELPEVETLARQLRPLIEGAEILEVVGGSHHRYAPARAVVGATVESLTRRGKYLLLGIGHGRELVLHLGMTGQLLWDREPRDHVHLGLRFPAGTLWFRDPRRFGRAELLHGGDRSALATLHQLGPEPDDPAFTTRRVEEYLLSEGSPVKARLLEQRLVAGVGNYIADEVLWRARVNPAARSITRDQARRLHRALRKVITDSVAAGGVSERDYVHVDGSRGGYAAQLAAHGRAGLPCLRCGQILLKSRVAGRGTVHCPRCQPL